MDEVVQALESKGTREDVDVAGKRVAWRRWGSGPDLVLLHGSAGSWTHWYRNIEAFSSVRTVHVPDIPGSGDSPAREPEPSLPALAALMLDSFERLQRDRGAVAAFDLAGFSFGSLLAEEMALLQPERVRRLILVRGSFDGGIPSGPKGLVKWREIADAAERRRAHRHNLATLMLHDPSRIDELAVDLHASNSLRATLNPIVYGATRSPDATARVAVPVHGITGEFDALGGGDVAAQGRALLRARPDATFDMIRGAGHWVAYEQPQAFNEAMLAVLSRPDARQPAESHS